MGPWKQTGERKLERDLRAQRPQPRDELVSRLNRQVEPPADTRGRRVVPKLALVAALTTVLIASLGATGAFGAAGSSMHAFGISVVHLVSPPKAAAHGGSAMSSNVTTTTTSYQNTTPRHYPFVVQYGGLIPICWRGSLIWVTPRQLIWYLFRGARPARTCGSVPINP
jgi:predicted phage tail protein